MKFEKSKMCTCVNVDYIQMNLGNRNGKCILNAMIEVHAAMVETVVQSYGPFLVRPIVAAESAKLPTIIARLHSVHGVHVLH